MIEAIINWNAIAAIAGVGAFSITMGTVIGRSVLHNLKERTSRRQQDVERRREEILIKQAIIGTPATDFEPEKPGLQKITAELQKGQQYLLEVSDELAKSHKKTVEAVAKLQQEILVNQHESMETAESLQNHIEASYLLAHRPHLNGKEELET